MEIGEVPLLDDEAHVPLLACNSGALHPVLYSNQRGPA